MSPIERAIPSPFTLIRQGIATGKFPDSDVRAALNAIVDSMEKELDNNQFEFSTELVTDSCEILQSVLIDLLQVEEEIEERKEIASSRKSSADAGELDTDDTDDNS